MKKFSRKARKARKRRLTILVLMKKIHARRQRLALYKKRNKRIKTPRPRRLKITWKNKQSGRVACNRSLFQDYQYDSFQALHANDAQPPLSASYLPALTSRALPAARLRAKRRIVKRARRLHKTRRARALRRRGIRKFSLL
jgi:hypothetical protein